MFSVLNADGSFFGIHRSGAADAAVFYIRSESLCFVWIAEEGIRSWREASSVVSTGEMCGKR